VVKVSDAQSLNSYAPNFDPQAINDEYMGDFGGQFASATAFLISPRLLLTHYHVFPTAACAGHEATRLCFDYDEAEGVALHNQPGCLHRLLQVGSEEVLVDRVAEAVVCRQRKRQRAGLCQRVLHP
jgi:hypothetical protein